MSSNLFAGRGRLRRLAGAGVAAMCLVGLPCHAAVAAADPVTLSGSLTDVNTCEMTDDPPVIAPAASQLTVTIATDALPDPSDSTAIALANTNATFVMPPDLLQSGVDLGFFAEGTNVPVDVLLRAGGTNTVPQGRTYSWVNTVAIVHVIAGVAQPLIATVDLPGASWRPIDATEAMVITERSVLVRYHLTLGQTPLTVIFDCEPTLNNAIVSIPGGTFPVPSPPTIGLATPGNASATVTFDPPGNVGGSAITGYTVTCVSPVAGAGSASGTASPIVVGGLFNGAPYSCTATATNLFGSSGPSTASNSFVPVSVPDPADAVQAIAGRTSAEVSYSSDANSGGSPMLDATATCTSNDGGATGVTTTTPLSSIAVGGLTAGKTYTCTVTTRNAQGSSVASAASNSFVPLPALPLPLISHIGHASGPGAGGTKVTMVGKNLRNVSAVRFGEVAATSFTVNGPGTRIVAIAPAESAGTVDVFITTDAGTSVAAVADQYTFLAPSVTKLSRATGPSGGGTRVTIRGKNLNAATTVTFGIVPASFTVNAAGTRIIAFTPAETAGTVDVLVTTPGGTNTLGPPARYTFL